MTTLVTTAQIAQLRRMVNESGYATYSNALLTTIIEKYPLLDVTGEEPWIWTSGTPSTATVNPEWVPTYDLNAAAAEIWDEKAAVVASKVDFSADGGNYSMSQQYEMYTKRARSFRSRRSMVTIRMWKKPEEPEGTQVNWIGNMREPID